MAHENGTSFQLLGIAGSLRKASMNRKLIQAVAPLVPAGHSYSTLDWDDVPIFNEDLETAELLPASVRRVREAVAVADAVIIASPEYNYSIPGPLKNLVDWLSRPYDRDGNLTRAADGLVPLSGKIVAICGLHPSPSGAATARGQMALRQALVFPNCLVLSSPFVAIAGGLAVFEEAEDGRPLMDLRHDGTPRSQMARLVRETLLACQRQGRFGRKDGIV